MRKWKLVVVAAAIAAGAGFAMLFRYDLAVISKAADAATPPNPAMAMMAMPVPVAKIVKKEIPIYLDYSARTEAIQRVTLQSKVAGFVQQQDVADGADVKEGDLLYQIDPRDYQAALDLARAQVNRDTAALGYARSNVERGAPLAKSGAIAKEAFEQRTTAVEQGEATLAMSGAAVRTAELNLGYTEIRAPFAGRLGRNQAPVGTLMGSGGAPLNTLVQLSPIYVTFNPSETDLAQVQQARAMGSIRAEVMLPGETQARHVGEVTFIDNAVDHSTGTIVARATIENADRSLLPGQYVRLRLKIRTEPDALMVPQTALGSSQLGKYVYVVGKDNKADQRLVSLGPTDGNLVAIRSGVGPDDQVINGNLQKIGPGAPVQPLPPH